MKSSHLKSLFTGALILVICSCEKKEENIEKLSEVKVQAIATYVYPLNENQMSDTILPKKPLPRAVLKKYESTKNVKVKIIDTICDEYIQGTKKVDLSGLKVGQRITRFGNSELTIITTPDFIANGLVRLADGPAGWWTHWNYSPYTESANPITLFVQNREGYAETNLELAFDKPVTTFGFEIAPNVIGKDVRVYAEYHEDPSYRLGALFQVTQTVSTPSGARLIAVKSQKPFVYVSIGISYFPELGSSNGIAISNIRYALPN